LALQKPFDGSIPENNCGAQRDPTKWTAMDSPPKKRKAERSTRSFPAIHHLNDEKTYNMGISGGRKILLAISWHDVELVQSRLKPVGKIGFQENRRILKQTPL